MITLGSNIHLHNFEALDYADNLIAKKLVGSYIRKICDRYEDCEYVDLNLDQRDGTFHIAVEVKAEGTVKNTEATGRNVFMTIDQALKAMLQELQITLD